MEAKRISPFSILMPSFLHSVLLQTARLLGDTSVKLVSEV